jgi:hypothetical protein
MSTVIKSLGRVESVMSCYGFGEYAHVSVNDQGQAVEDNIAQHLVSLGLNEIEVSTTQATIEDVFINLTINAAS